MSVKLSFFFSLRSKKCQLKVWRNCWQRFEIVLGVRLFFNSRSGKQVEWNRFEWVRTENNCNYVRITFFIFQILLWEELIKEIIEEV